MLKIQIMPLLACTLITLTWLVLAKANVYMRFTFVSPVAAPPPLLSITV
ncbi:hypothetical protein V2H77_01895 [Photorhabdus sp. P32]